LERGPHPRYQMYARALSFCLSSYLR
jgi:hypothetical protein